MFNEAIPGRANSVRYCVAFSQMAAAPESQRSNLEEKSNKQVSPGDNAKREAKTIADGNTA